MIMRPTDAFRAHHQELLDIVGEISGLLTEDNVAADASAISRLLAKFSGKLKGHLAMEDKVLYPKLLNHDDAHINHLASKFMTEMGGIADAVGEYMSAWSSAAKIQADPRQFIVQTKRLFSALAKRIDSEDNILYPALDSLG